MIINQASADSELSFAVENNKFYFKESLIIYSLFIEF